jgi:SNF2 family DNA or RNA helicase
MSFLDELFNFGRSEAKDAPEVRVEEDVVPTEDSLRFRVELVEGTELRPLSIPLDATVHSRAEISDEVELQTEMLSNLRVEGTLDYNDEALELALGDIYELEPEDRVILDLEARTDWTLKLDVSGAIGRGQNPISLAWTTPDGTYRPDAARYRKVGCGFYDTDSETLHILPEAVVAVRSLVEDYGEDFGGDRSKEYRMLGEIQGILERAPKTAADMIDVHGQIEQEDFIAPETVKVDFRQHEDGSLELRPLVDGFENFEDAEELAEGGDSRRLYTQRETAGDGTKTTRVALNESTAREVERVRRRRRVPSEDVGEFIRDPRSYVQPPEELAEERRKRAQELGVSTENLAEEDEDAEEILDLSSVTDRIGDLDLSLYGPRVRGFLEGGTEDVRRSSDGLNLKDNWLGPEDDGAPSPSDSDSSSETRSDSTQDDGDPVEEPGEELTDAMDEGAVLVPADNDEEVLYQEKVSRQLERSFEEYGAPSLFEGEFYDHQETGYAWLRNLSETDESAGGLLADDMGLGKTIQVIGLLAHLKAEGQLSPVLLVVPKTLVSNWCNEIERFCPEVEDVYEHLGTDRNKNPEFLANKEVLITTYRTLTIDQLALGQVEFSAMVCDEAQKIKNYTTKRASACRTMNARLKLALTATPVENALDELWSIVDFAQPGYLGSLNAFQNEFARPIESDDPSEGQEEAAELLDQLTGHYLRRTKEEELDEDLPDKHIYREEVPLTPHQQEMYDATKRWYRENVQQGRALGAIQTLLRVCAHPSSVKPERAEKILPEGEFFELSNIRHAPEEVVQKSGKLQWLRRQLSSIRERGEKAILYTVSRRLQLILQPLIKSVFGIRPEIINGRVAGSRRQEIIDEFNQGAGFDTIIMSPAAAGIGVNVTGANHVIHLTREWNPAKENQATDRAYRIGQSKDVHVYLPVATQPGEPTIDEKLDELLADKQDLARKVIRPSDSLKVSTGDLEKAL